MGRVLGPDAQAVGAIRKHEVIAPILLKDLLNLAAAQFANGALQGRGGDVSGDGDAGGGGNGNGIEGGSLVIARQMDLPVVVAVDRVTLRTQGPV